MYVNLLQEITRWKCILLTNKKKQQKTWVSSPVWSHAATGSVQYGAMQPLGQVKRLGYSDNILAQDQSWHKQACLYKRPAVSRHFSIILPSLPLWIYIIAEPSSTWRDTLYQVELYTVELYTVELPAAFNCRHCNHERNYHTQVSRYDKNTYLKINILLWFLLF